MKNHHKLISKWSKSGHINDENHQKANQLAKVDPTPLEWRSFLKVGLLWGAFLSICFGALFFFAFNWQEMSRMTKFSIIEVLMVIASLIYTLFSSKLPLSLIVLVSMTLLTGVLLALVGQTYQTGADPWQLFFVWAILVLPWTLLTKKAILWVIWVVLLNVSLYLYLSISLGIFAVVFNSVFNSESTIFIFALFNAALLILFEVKQQWLTNNNRRVSQLLVLLSGVPLTLLAIFSTLDSHHNFSNYFYYFIWAAGVFYWYQYKQPDLFVLSTFSLSVIIFIMSLFAKLLEGNFDAGGFLVLSLSMIVLSTVAGVWLKKTAKTMNELNVHQINDEDLL